MTGGSSEAETGARRLSLPTMLLVAAALIALASAAVALMRGGGSDSVAAEAPQAAATPNRPVGTVEDNIAALEAKLRERPNDATGWRMLGWSYYEIGNLPRSAAAYRRAAELEPNNVENWSSLGEALQTASAELSPEAAAAFQRAVKLDPADPRARYFLAVQRDLRGEHEGAVTDWIELLKDTPAGAPWEADLRRTIEQVAAKNKIDLAGRMPPPAAASAATAAIPGPTREQMAAASSIPPNQQSAMVKGMVDRLARRLEQNPRDANGWIRLMRARMVLGETDAAVAALRSGLAAFKGDAAAQAQLNRAAQELGVPRGS